MFRKWVSIGLVVMTLVSVFAMAGGASAEWVCTHAYTVQRGDTLNRIARANGTTVVNLQTLNGIRDANRITVGQVICIAGENQNNDTTHTVKSGETLYRIARRYNVTLQTLANANGITDTSRIYVGQVLTIPQ